MARIRYNVKGVDRSGNMGPTLPKGVYDGVIEKFEETKSKTKSDMWVVTIKITEPGWDTSRVRDRITLTENTQWKVDQFLQAVGFDTEAEEEGTFDPQKDVVGKPVRVRVDVGTYMKELDDGTKEERESNDVKGIFRSTGAMASLPNGDEPTSLEPESPAPAKAAAKTTKASKKAAVAPEPEPEPEAAYSDDELGELAEQADGEDEPSIVELTTFFEEQRPDLDPNDFATWVELVDLYIAERDGGEETPTGQTPWNEDMEIGELRTVAEGRGLATTGPKSAIIKRLKVSDTEEPF